MRILCLAKRTPDSKATVRPLADGSGIDPAGLRFVIDPFDEFGVEQAIRLKESRKDVSEIVVLGLGPTGGGADTQEMLRHALAIGADKAALATCEALPPHDEIAAADALAQAIRAEEASGGPFSLLFCGKQNIDNDAGELGPALAQMLDLTHIGACTKLDVRADGASVRASRRIEGAEEIIEAPTPLLITCEKGLAEARIPPLPKLMQAKKAPVAAHTVKPGGARGAKFVRLSSPPSRPPCKFLEGAPEQMAKDLVRLLRDEAKVI